MILSLFLLNCETVNIRIQPIPDYTNRYKEAITEKDMFNVNKDQIIDLKAMIYELWTYILKSDKKYIRVIDLRNEKNIKKYEKFIKENDWWKLS